MATIEEARAYVAANRATIDEAYKVNTEGFDTELFEFVEKHGGKASFEALSWMVSEFENVGMPQSTMSEAVLHFMKMTHPRHGVHEPFAYAVKLVNSIRLKLAQKIRFGKVAIDFHL